MMICDAGIWLCRLWVSHVSVSCCARVTGSGHTGRYLKIVLFMFLRLYNQFCPRLKWPDRRSRTRRTSTLRICPTQWRRATSRPCSRLMDRLLWTSSTLSSTPTSSWQGILRDTDHHYYHLDHNHDRLCQLEFSGTPTNSLEGSGSPGWRVGTSVSR